MILYTLDTDNSADAMKTAFVYLVISVVCGIFGATYELFSHGVYSFYMIYAFAFPLLGGALPFLHMAVRGAEKYPCSVARGLYHAGLAALTVGSIVKGVLDIYGTENDLVRVYAFVGSVLVCAGILVYAVKRAIKTPPT